MYSYITLGDETQIAYSNILDDQTIKIAVERPVDGGFDSATCFLPSAKWSSSEGFTATELEQLACLIKNNAPLIYRLAREAGKAYA